MKKLPFGKSDFEEIILNDFIYVDKTKYIFNLISNLKNCLLNRPSGFGKSTLVSTLENIFKGNKDLFNGLFIYDKIEWKKYPIIKISFTNISYNTPEILENSLLNRVLEIAEYYNVNISKHHYKTSFQELIVELSKIDKPVILIDDFDKPLIDFLENAKQSTENSRILQSFFATIKGSEEFIKFVFVTGESNFSGRSPLTDMNHLLNISLHYKYDSICGFTMVEITNYFNCFLERLAEEYNYNNQEIISKIKSFYEGYIWSKTKIFFNSASIVKMLYYNKIDKYWFKSKYHSFLTKLIKTKNYDLNQIENIICESMLFERYNIENISIISFMFQIGYLTIKNCNPTLQGTFYTLNYPNSEVKKSFLAMIY